MTVATLTRYPFRVEQALRALARGDAISDTLHDEVRATGLTDDVVRALTRAGEDWVVRWSDADRLRERILRNRACSTLVDALARDPYVGNVALRDVASNARWANAQLDPVTNARSVGRNGVALGVALNVLAARYPDPRPAIEADAGRRPVFVTVAGVDFEVAPAEALRGLAESAANGDRWTLRDTDDALFLAPASHFPLDL